MSQTLKAPARVSLGATDDNINKDCLITNNTKYSVVVLDAVGDNTSPSGQEVYEQSLKIWPTDSGAMVISSGQAENVTLNDYHMNNGVSTYSKAYELIIAQADNLFPVKSTHSALPLKSPQVYPGVTVSADDAAFMLETEQFYQTICAYPSGDLAKNYANALQSATDNSGSITDIDTAISKFFANTDFKDVTLDMIAAVTTYYSQYPFVWADYKTSKTYYMYSSDGTTVTFEGTVVINTPDSTPANPDKALPDYSFTYTDAGNKQTKLYYTNGQFLNDVNAHVPDICLQGIFQLKSELTKVDTDNIIIPVLIGTANTKSVLGYPDKLQQDSDGNFWTGIDAMFHPKTGQDYLNLFMTLTGVYMGLELILKGLKSLKEAIWNKKANSADGSDPSSSDVSALREQVKQLKTEMKSNYQQLADKMDANVKLNDNILDAMADYNAKLVETLNTSQQEFMEDSLDALDSMINSLMDYGNPQNIQDADDGVYDNYNKLENTTPETMKQDLSDVKTAIDNLTNQVKEAIQSLAADARTKAEAATAEDNKANEDAKDISDKIDDNRSKAENGDTPAKDEIEFTQKEHMD